jgi:micrococcal nuclease
MNMAPRILALLLLLCGALADAQQECGAPPCGIPGSIFSAKVIVVIDGDTVLILHGGHTEKVRLADMDAPEKEQDFGIESKQSLADMVLRKRVRVTARAVDKYGRTVALLSQGDLNVNEEQVRRGMAWAASGSPAGRGVGDVPVARTYSSFHGDRHYIALQDEAQQARRGLWSRPNPLPPWRWRKAHPLVPRQLPAEQD